MRAVARRRHLSRLRFGIVVLAFAGFSFRCLRLHLRDGRGLRAIRLARLPPVPASATLASSAVASVSVADCANAAVDSRLVAGAALSLVGHLAGGCCLIGIRSRGSGLRRAPVQRGSLAASACMFAFAAATVGETSSALCAAGCGTVAAATVASGSATIFIVFTGMVGMLCSLAGGCLPLAVGNGQPERHRGHAEQRCGADRCNHQMRVRTDFLPEGRPHVVSELHGKAPTFRRTETEGLVSLSPPPYAGQCSFDRCRKSGVRSASVPKTKRASPQQSPFNRPEAGTFRPRLWHQCAVTRDSHL